MALRAKMRLFLSSQDFGRHADVARRMAGDNPKAIYIKNAQDDLPETERNFSNPEKLQMFKDAGFEPEMIDLRDYFGEKDALVERLKGAGSFWSSGGNTFILRRAMKASGLDQILTELLAQDQIMYGGWSAGACIASGDLHGIEYGDRPSPDVVPDEYPIKEIIWEGLGLVDFMIIPHCNQEWFFESGKLCEDYFLKSGSNYKKLDDGQVIIVDGDKVEFLG